MSNWDSLDPSSFFRIITQPDKGQLGLPNLFVKEYGNEICSNVTLHVPSGGVFRVGIEKDESMLWLRDGWQRFAEHHWVTYGYFLWFKYKGNSEFDVAIFDLTATEIDYPCCCNCHSDKEFNSVAETTVSQHNNLCPAKTDDHQFIEISSSSETETEEIHDTTLFKSDNPYFSTKMKAYNLSHSFILPVPAEFSRTYLRAHKKSVELQDSDGNKWTIGVVASNGRVVCLSKGWCYFCRDKKLCCGDLCIFEVIKSDPVVIKVSIFPAKESAELSLRV